MLDKKSTLFIVSSIMKEVESHSNLLSKIGVRHGLAGLALLYFACYKFTNNAHDLEQGTETIKQCIDKLNLGYESPTIFSEMAEIGCMMELLKELDIIEEAWYEVLHDFDEVLLIELKRQINNGNYDPYNGALAYGFYFLKRKTNSQVTRQALELVDSFLYSTANKDKETMYWISNLKGKETIYLGLSHGSAAIIKYFTERNRDDQKLIKGAANYILKQELTNLPVYFPVEVNDEPPTDLPGQIYSNNWCYGDPGTLLGLSEAAIFLEDSELIEHCKTLLRNVVTRDLKPPYLASGDGLQYGRVGLSMIYYKLWEILGDSFLYKAYGENLKMTYSDFNIDKPFLGYKGYWNQSIPYTNYTMAEGIIGVALAFLACQDKSLHQFYRISFI